MKYTKKKLHIQILGLWTFDWDTIEIKYINITILDSKLKAVNPVQTKKKKHYLIGVYLYTFVVVFCLFMVVFVDRND